MNNSFIKPIDLSGIQQDKIKKQYESKYGKIGSSEYLHIWISKNNNIMVRHLIEMHEWTNDELLREVNLGQFSDK